MKLFRQIVRYVPVALLVAAALWLLPGLLNVDLPELLASKAESPWLAAGILLLLYCVKSVVMVIPVVLLYVSAGVLFPTWLAVLVTYLCLTAELSLSYYAGRRLGGHKVMARLEKNGIARKILKFTSRNDQIACFFARILPMPFDLMSMFFGASRVKYPTYLLASLLGASPVMLSYIFVGDAIADPLSKEFLIPFGISLAISGGAFIGYWLWLRRDKNEPAEQSAAKEEGSHEPRHESHRT